MLIENNVLTFSSEYIILTKKKNENNFNFYIFILLGILFCILLIAPTTEANAESFLSSWGSNGRDVAQFDKPWGIAVDSANNVYVVDNNNHRIQKFTVDGKFLTSWGSLGRDNGSFSFPHGIAVDSANNVYVVDNNNRIQKFTSEGKFLSAWGSSGAEPGSFSFSHGIAVDSANNVYVVDTNNNRIQKFTSEGKFLSAWGTQGVENGQFQRPWGIAVDSANNVYVVDTNNNRIQKFTSEGKFLSAWGSELLEFPKNIHISHNDIVYVVDTGSHQIQVFNSSGKLITAWGSAGKGFGSFLGPTGIAVNSLGNAYVVDHVNDRIQIFTSILDTEKPVLTIPSNITIETDINKGTTVPFAVTASDNVGVIGVPRCSHSPQSVFPIGTTTVTCQARDAIGNVGVASFEVLVKYNEPSLLVPPVLDPPKPKTTIPIDTEKPVLTIPSNITIETDINKGTTVPFAVTASDNVGVIGVPRCSHSPQSVFPIGTTTVTCQARDAIGNVGVASFEVLVKYNESLDYTTELAITTVGLVGTLGTAVAYKAGLLSSKASAISNSTFYSGSSGADSSYDLSSEISQESINESNPNENFEQMRAPSIEITVSWGFEK